MKESRDQKVVVAAVYVAAMFMAIMDTTIINVALPTVGREFHVGSESVGLISIAYLISLTAFIPVSGWFGDRIGGRRALLTAVAVFTIGSGLCGIATNFGELVAFRVVQGIGGAVMTPVGLAMLFRVYPPAQRVRISSTLALFTALAPASGPILGGLFTTYLSWRLVFFVNVPIGVAAFVLGATALADHIPSHPGRLDVTGLLLSGLGLGLLMYGVSEGPSLGWSNTIVLLTISLGAILLVALVIVELRVTNPLVDLHLFRNRMFALATSLYGLGSIAYLGALFLTALFLQNALNLSAIQSGLVLFPSALGVMTGGQIVTRLLYPRIGPRRIVVAGFLVVTATMMLMTRVGPGTDLWQVRLIMFGLGLGISFAFISCQAFSMVSITKAQIGRASSIFNASKQLGGAVGVALLSSVVAAVRSSQERAGQPSPTVVNAYHAGYFAAAAAAMLAIAVSLAIRDADADASMVAPARAETKIQREVEAREKAG